MFKSDVLNQTAGGPLNKEYLRKKVVSGLRKSVVLKLSMEARIPANILRKEKDKNGSKMVLIRSVL